MNKFANKSVRLIKSAISIIPTPVLNNLKKSKILVFFYRKILLRGGYIGSLKPWIHQVEAYENTLQLQAKELTLYKETFKSNRTDDVFFHIWVSSFETVESSVNSLVESGIPAQYIALVCPSDASVLQFKDLFPDCNSLCLASESDFNVLVSRPSFNMNGGDIIIAEALGVILSFFSENNDCIYYTDTDQILENGLRGRPRLLPNWDPELQLSTGYVKTAVFIPKGLITTFCSPNESSFSLSHVLSNVAVTTDENSSVKVNHVPLICLSETEIKQHSQLPSSWLPDNDKVTGIEINTIGHIAQIKWPVYDNPLVSLIIPTKNGKELVKDCIESILKKTTYRNYEILLVDNNSDDQSAIAYFEKLSKHPKITLLHYKEPFNYSAINNFAVKQANGTVVGLINNDIEVIEPEWLEYMVGHSLKDGVGCVGAKLLYSDKRVQHAGVVMGYGGGAGHAHKYFSSSEPGYLSRLAATCCYSAVTAACLIVRKELYAQVNGLNEKDLAVAFNDVDFCLKVRELGLRNIYCAEAVLYHHESVSRGLDISPEKKARFENELAYLKKNWAHYIDNDPCYNSYLTLKAEDFSLKFVKE